MITNYESCMEVNGDTQPSVCMIDGLGLNDKILYA